MNALGNDRGKTRSVLSWSIFGIALAISVGAAYLWSVNGNTASGVFQPQIFVVPGFGLVGSIVTSRSRNPIGPLFLALASVGAVTAFTFEYAVRAIGTAPGSLPLGAWAAATSNAGFPFTWLAFGLTLLLFPDGRLPTPRWRPVAWGFTITWGIATLQSLFVRNLDLAGFLVRNPIGVSTPAFLDDGVGKAAGGVFGAIGLALLIAAAAAPIVRRRRADAETRLQLRWLAVVLEAILVLALVAAPAARWDIEPIAMMLLSAILLLVALGIPGSIGIAVMKYRLYDIDVVVKKTVVFGLLAVFITVVYAAIVAVVSLRFEGSQAGSFLAAATLAILFAPARDRARKIADRFVYGKRATPYEVLADSPIG